MIICLAGNFSFRFSFSVVNNVVVDLPVLVVQTLAATIRSDPGSNFYLYQNSLKASVTLKLPVVGADTRAGIIPQKVALAPGPASKFGGRTNVAGLGLAYKQEQGNNWLLLLLKDSAVIISLRL